MHTAAKGPYRVQEPALKSLHPEMYRNIPIQVLCILLHPVIASLKQIYVTAVARMEDFMHVLHGHEPKSGIEFFFLW